MTCSGMPTHPTPLLQYSSNVFASPFHVSCGDVQSLKQSYQRPNIHTKMK